MDRLNRIWPPLLVLAAIVLLWWAAIVHSGSLIFPSPQQVAAGALELAADGTLWEHILASLLRVAAGFLLALLVALPLGLWMGRVEGAYRTLNPVFQIMRPISPIAWIPIAILWFGVGDVAPVFLIFLAAVFPLIVQTSAGVHAIDARYLRAAENFGVPRAKLFRQVIVPAVLPEVLTGMRIALGVAWLVVVAAEMIVRSSGLGFLIMDARNAGNRYDLVVAAMIIIGLIGLGLDVLMRRLEGLKQVRWRYAR
ncbi:ABC transporter permease [Massilia sp. UMI-21]|nr:ABC transporter permease [Massilia sp. UMI-21]